MSGATVVESAVPELVTLEAVVIRAVLVAAEFPGPVLGPVEMAVPVHAAMSVRGSMRVPVLGLVLLPGLLLVSVSVPLPLLRLVAVLEPLVPFAASVLVPVPLQE